jgi:hypothetical protein
MNRASRRLNHRENGQREMAFGFMVAQANGNRIYTFSVKSGKDHRMGYHFRRLIADFETDI